MKYVTRSPAPRITANRSSHLRHRAAGRLRHHFTNRALLAHRHITVALDGEPRAMRRAVQPTIVRADQQRTVNVILPAFDLQLTAFVYSHLPLFCSHVSPFAVRRVCSLPAHADNHIFRCSEFLILNIPIARYPRRSLSMSTLTKMNSSIRADSRQFVATISSSVFAF